MTCVIEVLTPELWERVKSDLGPHFRLHIERRSLDTSFIGTNRVVHMESKNYICFAPVMIRDKLSRKRGLTTLYPLIEAGGMLA